MLAGPAERRRASSRRGGRRSTGRRRSSTDARRRPCRRVTARSLSVGGLVDRVLRDPEDLVRALLVGRGDERVAEQDRGDAAAVAEHVRHRGCGSQKPVVAQDGELAAVDRAGRVGRPSPRRSRPARSNVRDENPARHAPEIGRSSRNGQGTVKSCIDAPMNEQQLHRANPSRGGDAKPEVSSQRDSSAASEPHPFKAHGGAPVFRKIAVVVSALAVSGASPRPRVGRRCGAARPEDGAGKVRSSWG